MVRQRDTGFYVMYFSDCGILSEFLPDHHGLGGGRNQQSDTVHDSIWSYLFSGGGSRKKECDCNFFLQPDAFLLVYLVEMFLKYVVLPAIQYLYFSKYAELFDEGIVSEQTGRVDKDCTCVDYEDNSGGCSGAESGAEPFKSCYGYSQEKCVDEGH